MSTERILETIGQVKDEFVVEAAPKGLLNDEKADKKSVIKAGSKAKIYRFAKWGALAACLCLIVGLGMKMNMFTTNDEASFERKETAMNQSAETESAMEKADRDGGGSMYESTMNQVKTDYNTTYGYTTGGESGTVTEDTAIAEETPASDAGFPDWGITLSVKNVTSTGLTLVVTQAGGNPSGELNTGEAYRLIALVDDTWKTVEELPLPEGVDGRAWNSLAYYIPKNETVEFDINWEWIFGELPGGTYRLIKEFMDFRETANYDTFEYWVEFVIE